ncbi:hypothetical protein JCM10213_006678 [Rhodosporidiobolus nylandii]
MLAPVLPCVVCGAFTSSHCGGCDLIFCSRDCQKLIWSTHKWLCGKPTDSFVFAPLTDDEVYYLRHLSGLTRMEVPGHALWPVVLWRQKIWAGQHPKVRLAFLLATILLRLLPTGALIFSSTKGLLNRLKRPDLTSIEEPRRSLILAELHGILPRAAQKLGFDNYAPSPWSVTGAFYRRVVPLYKSPAARQRIFAVLNPLLRTLLVYFTLCARANGDNEKLHNVMTADLVRSASARCVEAVRMLPDQLPDGLDKQRILEDLAMTVFCHEEDIR